MPIKKTKKESYLTFFRISSLWETEEDDVTVLHITCEILPRYPSGLPEEADTKLSKKLEKAYLQHKEYLVNKVGIIIRDLAVEVMNLSSKMERSEKLKDLKLFLVDSEYEYNPDHYLLEITFKFKPLMKPVFEADFYHSAIIYQEELKKNALVSAAVIRHKIKNKNKSIFPVLKSVKGGKKNA